MNVLGIDIGGSSVKGAPVNLRTGRLVAERFRIATPEPLSPAAMARKIAEIAAHFKWRGAIGVGFPGVVHGPRTMTSANLHPKFVGCDAGKLFAKATRCPVSLVNDADAAGIAEMKFGAGRDKRGMVLLITLGTGVGTAMFYRGMLCPNTEFGHLPIRGRSAERYISTAARKRRRLSWAVWGAELGAYLRTLEMLLWPDLIIIGGGASAKSKKFFKYIRCRAPVVAASAFNEAGIVGAALWTLEEKRNASGPAKSRSTR